jgi:zinc transport system substrate-binding protein
MTVFKVKRRQMLAMLLSAAAFPLAAQDRPVVATDNYPLAYFAQRLGGGEVDVVFPVPDGIDPSFWRPGISDITAIQKADLIALNGAGFSTWPTKASLPRSRTVDTSAGFQDRLIKTETVTHSHGEGGQHSHTATANYTWLDFSLAMEQAKVLADAMIRQMPERASQIETQREALLADLTGLDTRAADLGAEAADLSMIASHPRYQYFASAYGLTISSVEWDAQEEPTKAQWTAFEKLQAETGARLFIWEAEPSVSSRERMSTLGLVNVVFPPLATTPTEGDFLDLMIATLERLKEAIGQAS